MEISRRSLSTLVFSALIVAMLCLASSASAVVGGFSSTGSLRIGTQDSVGVTLASGKVLIAGGQFPPTARAELYDPASGTFSDTGSLTAVRYSADFVKLSDGRILVVGGYSAGFGRLDSAEIYNPTTGQFTSTGSMATARAHAAIALLNDGTVLVAGGDAAGGPTASAEIYDPVAGTFSPTGALAAPRLTPSFSLLSNGKVLVAGGQSTGYSWVATAELYDPTARTFSNTGSMTVARTLAPTVRLQDGRILVIGGTSPTTLASAETYDTATEIFTAVGSMSVARLNPSASILPDGRVLVAGGASGSTRLSSAEVFSPSTNAFSATGGMATARSGAMASLLANGLVLIAGGSGDGGYVTAGELYNPAADGSPCPSAAVPPSGAVGVSINNGALYTNSPKVTLNLVWPACTTTLSVSNDGGFKSATSFPPAATIDWTLASSGPERLPKMMYLRFGSSTQTYTDDIILDQTPPKLTSVTAVPIGTKTRVTTKASDKTSGIGKIQITVSKKKPGKAIKYAKIITFKASASTIWVRVQDRAGNWSVWKSVRKR